jgi:integrase
MPKKALSQKVVDSLPKSDKLVHYFDENITGFGVDVKMNNKSYFVRGRVNGRLISYTFGKCNVMEFDEAKKKAKVLLTKIDAGIHPAEEDRQKIKEAEAEIKKNFTLKQILDEYLENTNLKDSTKKTYKTHIQAYLHDWQNTPMRKITQGDIKARHKFLSNKIELPPKTNNETYQKKSKKKRVLLNGPGVADGVMKTLRALFTHAIEEHEITSVNPVGPALKKQWNRLPSRINYLRPDQLGAWLQAANSSSNDTMRDALLLLLFTGLRSKSEAFSLKWEQIDFVAKNIHIPDPKNKTPFVLPMNSLAFKLLKSRNIVCHNSDFIFPCSGKKGHIVDARKELGKICSATGITLTPHDFRRTFQTYAESLDLSPYTIKSLVNHNSGKRNDVTAGYIQISTERMRKASQKVANYMIKTVKASQ